MFTLQLFSNVSLFSSSHRVQLDFGDDIDNIFEGAENS